MEILTKDAACPFLWVLYTAGDPIPFGAVAGGRHVDRSDTCLVKVDHDDFEYFGYQLRRIKKLMGHIPQLIPQTSIVITVRR